MTRTQIYLTPSEVQGVAQVAAASGRKNSEVIREAIDEYLNRLGLQDRLERLRAASGLWSDRGGVDLAESREEFDRF
jgi:predicted DNA-binding protein